MVDAAHAASPSCEVLTTRKSMPGVKDLLVEATIAGGAFPHRLGLSETVLVFDHHLSFMGGIDAFIEQLPQIRSRCIEKKLFVEVNAEQALALAWHNAACTRACAASRGAVAWAGVDGVQLDKVAVDELAELVGNLRALDPRPKTFVPSGPQHKLEFAEQLMADFPDMRFILIGDDGQKDPTTYATIARRYPGRVLAIGIRQLSPREATGLSSMMGMTSTQPMPVTDVPVFTGTTGSNIMKTMLPYLKQKLGRTDLAE